MGALPVHSDVVVVGAGLSGLAAAVELTARGADVVLVEAAEEVGGRVATDRSDGFLLDRGFQVLSTAYPEARRVLDLDALRLRPFSRAVTVHTGGRTVTLGDPRRDVRAVPRMLGAPVGSLSSKAALARYAAGAAFKPTETLLHQYDAPAAGHWRRHGLSADTVERLLRPFFAGVTLDAGARTSGRFVDLMLRMFVRGESAVPAEGMGEIPRRLAERLPAGVLRLGLPVRRVAAGGVATDSGSVQARAVVVATDPATASALVPGVPLREGRGVTTWYHAVDTPVAAEPTLIVDADDSPVDNTVVITAAAPGYAPPGQSLVATSAVHRGSGAPPSDAEPAVRRRLAELYRTSTSRWQHVATYDIPYALPAMTAPHPFTRPERVGDVYVCGDHRDTSSIQGALFSGRRVARRVAADLGL